MSRRSRTTPAIKVFLAAALGLIAVLALPAIAAAKDRNHDRIPDRWEKRHHLSLKVNQARRDQDRDSLRNRAEFRAGTNPRDKDSDNDGVPDSEENAGTVAGFDATSGTLTIDLFAGGQLSGQVSDLTEIKCDTEGEHSQSEGVQHGGSQGSDESSDPVDPQGEESNDPQTEDPSEEPEDPAAEEENESEENQSEEQAENGEHSQSGENQSGSCTTADLTEGTTVHEAKLDDAGTAFTEVELVK